ncbi:DUF1553 domain-containing protein [Tuwongella immobilis]|uniref:Cytochrome c domain-containing protein n=1 Tax=Tuwongella immobilis TaxID=692036 RepID=A0A6C2YQT5_9BACT|nr:PSD1 and planctomycete cytochrome C domain-containing protein [Tuwongella immobilis]VIP04008.1 secreted protein containing duf1549 : Putative membrane protein OS=Singulisphaera acidiphila (strain ATCC BAA-1392 / DSM 18658 / VKM B-2454 / MOB10) GN=Sinac_5601 PE=4 SV=1: PSCyt1: PSCyt2: PSD1 [Tuwongella immobilis]VTS05383.1 secreted protein containing duf1549 : Putative membrane protein OS=Singulisphaera acidiphila (strain ATCC BAA-1392 / DSM 18658 / VKM B-2454 / MOB10) GN=Sinac_5601 PE=4 SV=1: P
MMHSSRLGIAMMGLFLGFFCGRSAAAGEPAPDFARDVRPILSSHCFQCHGPDAKTRKGGLRLDLRDAALKPGKSGELAIVPGKPDASELVARIHEMDESVVMPPPEVKKPLNAAQKAILVRWIQSGAEYPGHWAFQPPKKPTPPTVKDAAWVRNPIDAFVRKRLEAEGLTPAPEADRPTLIRRLSYDLIGLPPTIEETEAFLNDRSPDAVERLVDRLLASPHYGERWGRLWLDLARYADTNGYEKDRPRSIWPYRDWVIDAINRDMPFDRFTIEQLAGDLLPNATESQRVATGFHRNTMLNEEGGIDPLEFRYHAMADRVATTGKVWLGLTVGCAQCHTHKFDPITHREYFGMFAFLNNADEPRLPLKRPEILRKRQELQQQIDRMTRELPQAFGSEAAYEKAFADWLAQVTPASVAWQTPRPAAVSSNLPLLTIQPDHSIFVSGDSTKSDTYEIVLPADGKPLTGLRIEAMADERLPAGGPGRVDYEGPYGSFTLCEVTVLADGKPVPLHQATASYANGHFTAAAAIDGNPQTGWDTNGRQGQSHWAVFPFQSAQQAKEYRVKLLFERHYAAGLGRFRLGLTESTGKLAARELPTEIEAILAIPADKRSAEQGMQLRQTFLQVAPQIAKERSAIDAIRKQMPEFPHTLVMQERPAENPRKTFLHHRGEWLQPAEAVEPTTLAVLPEMPATWPKNRLSFAKWLVSPNHPLVGRVTMNRQWAAFFGKGIVSTVGDFGYQGEFPSHPELLDWLAIQFVESGWSMKAMHRLMVTSATYRQQSRVTAELLKRDPDNRLLARGPRVRLEAEMIRDGMLRASGLLTPTIGGPSVFPPQPPGVTTEGTYGQIAWRTSTGPDRYRRGLYTFAKRTAPYAAFATFDGPSGEVCVARREVSNTPLQALTLLNDVVFLEAAQALAKEVMTSKLADADGVEMLFRRILTRFPTTAEQQTLRTFLANQSERLAKQPDEAKRLAPNAADAPKQAAWTLLARAIMNLDEAIVRE